MNSEAKRLFGPLDTLLFKLALLLSPVRPSDARRVLFIEQKVPELDVDAGSKANYDLLKALVTLGYHVHFLQTRRKGNPVYHLPLQALGIELLTLPPKYASRWLKKHARSFGLVIFSRPAIAEKFHPVVKSNSTASTILFGHDIHFQRLQRQSSLLTEAQVNIEAQGMESVERSLWRAVDLNIYLSQDEVDEIRRLEPTAKVESIVPYCWDTFQPRTKAPAGKILLFVAGFGHRPNSDAALWFAQNVLPLVIAKSESVTLYLAGSNPTEEICRLENDHITVTGPLSDEELAKLYATARVAVIPLRFGAGVKLKVVEALRYGLPMVTTPIGTQGLDGIESFVKPTLDPDSMASLIIGLLDDDSRWMAQSHAQTAYAEARFSAAVYQDRISELVKNL